MTYQQRVEILKALPRGSEVMIFPKGLPFVFEMYNGVKLEDRTRGMIVQFKGNKTYIGYRRLTCEKIRKAEEVIVRLQGHSNGNWIREYIRKYPRTFAESFNFKP